MAIVDFSLTDQVALVTGASRGNVEQIAALFERIDSELGRLDILVNNAAHGVVHGRRGSRHPGSQGGGLRVRRAGARPDCQALRAESPAGHRPRSRCRPR